jgi:PAS domain S-box-containing protein
MTASAEGTRVAFLSGTSEMARRMRDYDWTRTPLGHPEQWPQSLRSAVSILLPSKAQIALFWGPDLITLYNDAYRPVFGAKHPRGLGLPVREAWSEIWETGLRTLFEGVLTTGEAFWATDHPFFLERYGYPEETFFDVSYDPVRDESGQVGGVFCIVSETTGRVIGERRLQTLRMLSARTTDGARSVEQACRTAAHILAGNRHDLPFTLIYMLDAGGASARLAGATGLPDGSPAAPERVDLTAPDADAVWPLGGVRETGHAEVVGELGRRVGPLPGGAWPESPHTAVVLPISTGGHDRLAGFLVAGISPRRPLDDAYRGFLEVLANQCGTAFAHARAYEEERSRAEALAEIDRAKTVFFSNVSHEFRTPLTLMLGPTEEMLAGATGEISAVQRDLLETVRGNALRLQKLVNTLLDFARMEAGRIDASYERGDLSAHTRALAGAFRSAVERAGLTLTVECPPLDEPVWVDRDMWEKLVLNLLSNAFKFTFSGGIHVSLHAEEGGVALRVRDSGVGIPAEALPSVFDRFHRTPGMRARTHEGSGIGLALVREIVKLHGGSIEVDSVVGAGTTFTVLLPTGTAHLPKDRLAAPRVLDSTAVGAEPFVSEALRWLPDGNTLDDGAPPAGVDAPAGTPASTKAGRILLVDDNADMRQYVGRLLAQRYDVETAADGAAALAAVKVQPPDLVLADVMTPGLDGFALLRELRAEVRTQAIPVVLLSARAGEEARVEGMQAGADDYLVKPFSARELLARVEGLLRLTRVRETMQATVRASEQRLAGILRQASVGVAQTDPTGRLVFVNERFAQMVGRPREDLLRLRMEDITHAEDLPRNRELHQRMQETGDDFVIEKRYLRPDGTAVWVQNSVYALRGSAGEPETAVEVSLDVTARREAESALRESEARFRNMADNAPVMIWVTDPSGECTYLNRQWGEFTGQGADTGLGHGWIQAVHPADREPAAKAFADANRRRVPLQLEYRLRRADGEYRWSFNSGAPRFGPAGQFLGFIGSVIDVHDRRQVEERQRQSTKMEAIGRLAGGLAHDFNNQLHALAGFADFVARDAGLSGRSRHDLLEIRKATERMASLTRQLLAFSRQQVLMPETLDLNDAVRDAQTLLQRLLGSDIEMSAHLAADPVWVRVDRGQLLQVLMNLAINARDAMPAGGDLTLETARRDVRAGELDEVAGIPVASGRYAMLVATDHGTGIALEHLPHLFEPFFTTKEVGKGTGLGLATVHGIVTQSQGYIWAENAPHGGATFTVLLPLAEEVSAAAPGTGSPRTMAPRPVRILVVDDEDAVGDIIVRTLEAEGYVVLQARDGKEALDQLERARDTIDALVCDVVMPVLGGRELGKHLAETRPQLPVVWMSGYPRDAAFSQTFLCDDQPFLQKPIPPDLLLETVRKAVEGRVSAAG